MNYPDIRFGMHRAVTLDELEPPESELEEITLEEDFGSPINCCERLDLILDLVCAVCGDNYIPDFSASENYKKGDEVKFSCRDGIHDFYYGVVLAARNNEVVIAVGDYTQWEFIDKRYTLNNAERKRHANVKSITV